MRRLASHPNPRLRRLRPGGGVPPPSLWYRACRRAAQVGSALLWKIRVLNRHYEPTDGGALYICNHQSFLDPVVMALALRRPMNYMGRASLFRFHLLRPLMESLNAFPIRRGGSDLRAMKEAMRRLKAGAQLVVFPEGTRTEDGRIQPFLPGVALLAQRAADWIVPVVIDGAFEAWPRTSLLFGTGVIVVQYAPPIPQTDARTRQPHELLGEIRRRMIEMQTDLRRRIGRRPLVYDDVTAQPCAGR